MVPGTICEVATVVVESEQEIPHGWKYRVLVRAGPGEPGREDARYEIRLDWVDHDHWSGGRCPPSRVVEALVRYLLDRSPERSLPDRFDAATARRWCPELDRELPGRI